MFEGFKILEANMGMKLHFLQSHLDRFPENLENYSEEQGDKIVINIALKNFASKKR